MPIVFEEVTAQVEPDARGEADTRAEHRPSARAAEDATAQQEQLRRALALHAERAARLAAD